VDNVIGFEKQIDYFMLFRKLNFKLYTEYFHCIVFEHPAVAFDAILNSNSQTYLFAAYYMSSWDA
jgi:hypothetical protein